MVDAQTVVDDNNNMKKQTARAIYSNDGRLVMLEDGHMYLTMFAGSYTLVTRGTASKTTHVSTFNKRVARTFTGDNGKTYEVFCADHSARLME